MANSFILFLSSLALNYIVGTSLVTILLGEFFLFLGYFISKDSLPKYWLFTHIILMYKYAFDALLINKYSCLVSMCLVWYKENKTCMVTGSNVLQKRGLREGRRWKTIYILIGFFTFYHIHDCTIFLGKKLFFYVVVLGKSVCLLIRNAL